MAVEIDTIKVGDKIRWNADRTFRSWNTFGEIVNVDDASITVLTYDDFKETKLSKLGEAVKDEISLCSIDDVSNYIRQQIVELNYQKGKIQIEYDKAINDVDNKILNINRLYKQLLTHDRLFKA